MEEAMEEVYMDFDPRSDLCFNIEIQRYFTKDYDYSVDLPDPICVVAISYHPTRYMMLTLEMTPDASVINVPDNCIKFFILHGIFDIIDRKTFKHPITPDLSLLDVPDDILEELKKYMPYITENGSINPDFPELHLQNQILKHLPYLPFLPLNDFAGFALGVYKKFGFYGLMRYLYDEASKKQFVSRADPGCPAGWWGIPMRNLCEICSYYPDLQGALLDFRTEKILGNHFLKEILIGVTMDLEPAGRKRNKGIVTDMYRKGVADDTIIFFMDL